MPDINLTQHAENLKSLQQNLLKICGQYHHAQKSFLDLQAQVRCAWHQVNHAWSQVIDLFVLIDEMRDDVSPLEFETKES